MVLNCFTCCALFITEWGQRSLSGILLVEATRRIMKPQPVDGRLMSAVALLGLVVNLFMALVLV